MRQLKLVCAEDDVLWWPFATLHELSAVHCHPVMNITIVIYGNMYEFCVSSYFKPNIPPTMKIHEKLGYVLQTVYMLILPGTFVYSNNKGVSNTRPGSLSISLIHPIRLEHDATELSRNFIVFPLTAGINYQLCMWYYIMLSTS